MRGRVGIGEWLRTADQSVSEPFEAVITSGEAAVPEPEVEKPAGRV